MKTLSSIYLFQFANTDGSLLTKMQGYNKTLDNLDLKHLDEYMRTIGKRFSFPLKSKIIDDVSHERVIPLYNRERIQVPIFIPSFLYLDKDKVKALVNLTKFGDITKEGNFNIQINQLYALLQCGTVLLGCFNNWNRITINQSISRLGVMIYSKLMLKILDKMFVVNIDPIKSDQLKFLSGKFFLLNQLERSNSDLINNMAYNACTNDTTMSTIMKMNDEIDPIAYTNINEFLKVIASHFTGMGSLNIKDFLNEWLKMYDQTTLFALEYFPFLCHMVMSVAVSAHLNKEYVIENLLTKEIDKFMNEISNIIKL